MTLKSAGVIRIGSGYNLFRRDSVSQGWRLVDGHLSHSREQASHHLTCFLTAVGHRDFLEQVLRFGHLNGYL